MKVHVTLVNPSYPNGAPQSLFISLGIGYLAAVLEQNQHEVEVIDCQILRLTDTQLEHELTKSQPDVVGVTSSSLTYNPAADIVKKVKKILPSCLTVMGGSHATVLDEQTLKDLPELDIVVRGEGEQTMLQLVELVSKNNLKNLYEVDGITFRSNNRIVRTKDRSFIQNIDELPHPAYGHFPLSKYRISGRLYLPIITSRGCPYRCKFCLAPRMCGKEFRGRSPKKVVDELEWLRDVHRADAFTFYDDTFTFDMKRAYEICEEMERRGFDLPWDCRTRVDRISEEILVKMRDANCQLIHFGIESGNQEILNAMNKGTTVEQNAYGIRLAKKIGIPVAVSVVVGFPGETADMLKQTFDFIRKTKPDFTYVCQAIPFPGTELLDLLRNLDWDISTNWNKYDEQSQVFENPSLSFEKVEEMRGDFYNNFFSPSYFLHKSLKKDFYSQKMARVALNHLLWRARLPGLISGSLRKLAPRKQ